MAHKSPCWIAANRLFVLSTVSGDYAFRPNGLPYPSRMRFRRIGRENRICSRRCLGRRMASRILVGFGRIRRALRIHMSGGDEAGAAAVGGAVSGD